MFKIIIEYKKKILKFMYYNIKIKFLDTCENAIHTYYYEIHTSSFILLNSSYIFFSWFILTINTKHLISVFSSIFDYNFVYCICHVVNESINRRLIIIIIFFFLALIIWEPSKYCIDINRSHKRKILNTLEHKRNTGLGASRCVVS